MEIGKYRKVIFSQEETEYIREAYKTMCCDDIGDKLGVTGQTIRLFAKRNGFERSPDWDKSKFYGRYTWKRKEDKVLRSQNVTSSQVNN